MNSIKLQVKTKSQNYPIFIGNNVLNRLKKHPRTIKTSEKNIIDHNDLCASTSKVGM